MEDAQLGAILFNSLQSSIFGLAKKMKRKKAQLLEGMKNEHIPRCWGVIDKWIQDNKSETGWFEATLSFCYVDRSP